MTPLEKHISAAEVHWKSGDILLAIKSAQIALLHSVSEETTTALWIFTARGYTKLKNYELSNQILRKLINEKIYLPPVILTLCYNNLCMHKMEKSLRNTSLVKIFIDDEHCKE